MYKIYIYNGEFKGCHIAQIRCQNLSISTNDCLCYTQVYSTPFIYYSVYLSFTLLHTINNDKILKILMFYIYINVKFNLN